MDFTNHIDHIWLYSKYYGDMVASSFHLNELGESYGAIVILFNAMELIFKSIRENDKHNINDDIEWLKDNDYISSDEAAFLNDKENGVRKLRNLMTHKDLYEYCLEIDDKAYPFATKETWEYVFGMTAPQIVIIMDNAISKKMI